MNEKCIDVNSGDSNTRASAVCTEGLDCVRAQSLVDLQTLAFPRSSTIAEILGIAKLDRTLRIEGQCCRDLLP